MRLSAMLALIVASIAVAGCEAPSDVIVEGIPAGLAPATPPPAGFDVARIAADLRAGDLVEVFPTGEINWTRGEIIAIGQVPSDGRQTPEMAGRAARIIAARNGLLMLSSVRVGSRGRLANLQAGHLQVQGVLRDFEELPSDSPYTCRLRMGIHGKSGLINRYGVAFRAEKGTGSFFASSAKKVPVPASDVLLVIDARGTSFRPSLLPRIVDENGHVIWTAAGSPPERMYHGPAIILLRSQDPDGAIPPAASGLRTISIRTVGTPVADRTTLVLPPGAAADPSVIDCLNSGRAVILLD